MRLTGRNIRATFERAAAVIHTQRYVLKLYVTGKTLRSTQGVENVRAICDEYLEGRYDLEVIDIYQQPALLAGEGVGGTDSDDAAAHNGDFDMVRECGWITTCALQRLPLFFGFIIAIR